MQSPAVDIVGIGFASGEVSIYDIRADEQLLCINMGAGMGPTGSDAGTISAVGFRSGQLILRRPPISSLLNFHAFKMVSQSLLQHRQRVILLSGISMRTLDCYTSSAAPMMEL